MTGFPLAAVAFDSADLLIIHGLLVVVAAFDIVDLQSLLVRIILGTDPGF